MTSIGGFDLAALVASTAAGVLAVTATARRRRTIRVRNETRAWLASIRCARTEEWLRDLAIYRPELEETSSRWPR